MTILGKYIETKEDEELNYKIPAVFKPSKSNMSLKKAIVISTAMHPLTVFLVWLAIFVAGLLGIFLGGIGVHKFYLGKIGMGILYVCLCWTGIPAIVGCIEGIIYLCSNDENFQLKNHVRIG